MHIYIHVCIYIYIYMCVCVCASFDIDELRLIMHFICVNSTDQGRAIKTKLEKLTYCGLFHKNMSLSHNNVIDII